MRTQPWRLMPVLAIVLACTSPTAPTAEGDWGGSNASLSLSRTGGTLSYACGAGTMDSGWILTDAGLLTGTGKHFFGGGPLPIQGRPPHPATYSGRIDGRTLTLTVTLTDLGQVLGPFLMLRGGPKIQEMCL